jgi:hypothetical protein
VYFFVKEYYMSEKTYLLTIDATAQSSKPSKKEFGAITNRMTIVTGLTITEFSTYVSDPYSYTWSGGVFEGSIKNENWTQQSIFALDFDGGLLTVEDVYLRLAQYDIVPQLYYNTFSSTLILPKFRVVLFMDSIVIDEKIHKLISDGLLSLFPEADSSCKNRGRMFLGGKESTVTGTEPISTEKLCARLGIHLITKDGNRTRNIPNVRFFDSSPNLGEKQALLYNINRSSRISPTFQLKDKPNTPTTNILGREPDIIDFKIARTKVKLLDEFLNGTWLYHTPLFGLATNLVNIKGGRKLMNQTMEKYNKQGKTQYTDNNFNIMTYLGKVNYPPTPIHQFSPYPEDKDLFDMVSATKDVRGFIQQLEPIEKMDLKDAEELFKDEFEQVINTGEVGKIYLFYLPTAIGKTEAITSVHATIAAPTNSLKNEIGGRMKVSYHCTPDPVEFKDDSINKKLKYYYSIGLPQKSLQILNHVANPSNIQYYLPTDVEQAIDYIKQVKSSYTTTDTLLTTHRRAIFTPYLNETIIFDEDPLNSLIEIKKLFITDLFALNLISKNEELNCVIDFLRLSIPTEIRTTPTFNVDIEELINTISKQSDIDSNVFDFFESSYFVKDTSNPNKIHYVIKREPPKDKKIIVLSATIPIFIYQKLYGDRIEVIDISDVKQQGTVIQHTKKSCSRNSLNRYHETISKEVGDKPVITFKSFKNHFNNPVEEMYFGNCSGYDTLKGQDIVVVGTPHRNNVEYFLTAKVLGIEFKTTDTTMTFQQVTYNGFKFKFNCFDNEDLRMIQFALIESDLIQAIGRARTLRTDAKVEVYSNYPLRISDEFIF